MYLPLCVIERIENGREIEKLKIGDGENEIKGIGQG